MDYNKELEDLKNKYENAGKELIKKAEKDGYYFDMQYKKFIKEDKGYYIHITISSLGVGEYLGNFEIYDKIFPLDEKIALEAIKIDNLDDFIDKVLFFKNWDDDFKKCNAFEEASLSDWFYFTTDESDYDAFKNIITFRFSYLNSMMGNVTIMKCSSNSLEHRKDIYHCTENYVFY